MYIYMYIMMINAHTCTYVDTQGDVHYFNRSCFNVYNVYTEYSSMNSSMHHSIHLVSIVQNYTVSKNVFSHRYTIVCIANTTTAS